MVLNLTVLDIKRTGFDLFLILKQTPESKLWKRYQRRVSSKNFKSALEQVRVLHHECSGMDMTVSLSIKRTNMTVPDFIGI